MEERPVWIALNDVNCAALSCSPHDRQDLAVGHLLSEGWIAGGEMVIDAAEVDGPGGSLGVRVRARDARIDETRALHQHQTVHGCGLRHTLDCEPTPGLRRLGGTEAIDPVGLLRRLFDEAGRIDGGGTHTVALCRGDALVAIAHDVARHCAVDRVIGAAVRAGARLDSLGLVSTARISGAMALKAARTGLRWIASRSIATSLAREIAVAHGVVLYERAGGRRG